MPLPLITLGTAAVLALIFVGLSVNVVRYRSGAKISLGDDSRRIGFGEEFSAPPLFIAARIHANFAEYVPLSLLLLMMIELIAAPRWAVEVLAAMLIIARLIHPIGMVRSAPNPFRAGGMMLQWAMLVLGGVYALVLVSGLM